MRLMLYSVAMVIGLMNSSMASGVTAVAANAAPPTALLKVTTGAVARAQIDVQIRRLHQVLVSSGSSQASERAFDQLERLEKGQRAQE